MKSFYLHSVAGFSKFTDQTGMFNFPQFPIKETTSNANTVTLNN